MDKQPVGKVQFGSSKYIIGVALLQVIHYPHIAYLNVYRIQAANERIYLKDLGEKDKGKG